MNKREWFERLENELKEVSPDEVRRVREYYEELFDDKSESGYTEQEILREFGAPESAARRIAGDCDEREDSGEKSGYNAVNGHFSQNERQDEEDEDKPLSKFGKAFSAICPIAAVLLFFIDGAVFGRWGKAWLLFLAVPVLISFEKAIERKNPKKFVYPVFVVAVYLSLGLYFQVWHPSWVIFFTIPLYYVIVGQIVKENEGNGWEGEKSGYKSINARVNQKKPEKSKMSKRVMVIVSICLVAVIVLSISGGIAYRALTNAFVADYNEAKINLTENISSAGEEVTAINVTANSCPVIIEQTDGEVVAVGYINESKNGMTVRTGFSGGVVNISAESEGSILRYLWRADIFIRVGIPENIAASASLTVTSDAGEIRLLKEGNYSDISIEADAGKITIENVNAANVVAKALAGQVKVANVSAKTLRLETSAGAIKAENCVAESGITAKSNAGAIKIDAVCPVALITNDVGSVRFTLTSDVIRVLTNVGSIKGTVRGVKDEYSIDAYTRMGSCNLESRTLNATDKLLYARADTGSIKISFEN